MHMEDNHDVSAIILAAGTSSRMGRTKQLMLYKNQTFIEHVIKQTTREDFTNIQIVIGHDRKLIQQTVQLKDTRCQWVMNPNYLEGQSTSFMSGLKSLPVSTKHVMVFLVDLPFLQSSTIHKIYIYGQAMANKIDEPFTVRPVYQNIIGHPVFFGNVHIPLFSKLKGDKGAKEIIQHIPIKKEIAVTDKGVIWDIDTSEAYRTAIQQFK